MGLDSTHVIGAVMPGRRKRLNFDDVVGVKAGRGCKQPIMSFLDDLAFLAKVPNTDTNTYTEVGIKLSLPLRSVDLS